ncbi:pyridoxamine 5'-phosphate oxidase family protein [Streptomyces sp. Edi4]|uniref:pyridoxamine 5'-phosphate oxidase family protein n=1 Tax=Streptomyces sp. Edi4 TaxID=3162527 RepID=UPI0033065059
MTSTPKDTAPVIPADYADLLTRPLFVHLATTGPRGVPHVNPVWRIWDGAFLRFTTTTTRRKYKNVVAAPKVSLSVRPRPALPVSGGPGHRRTDRARPYGRVLRPPRPAVRPGVRAPARRRRAPGGAGDAPGAHHQAVSPGGSRAHLRCPPPSTTWRRCAGRESLP